MNFLDTQESLLATLDTDYASLHAIARQDTSMTTKTWVNHFDHLWSTLLDQLGWSPLKSRKRKLLERFISLRRFPDLNEQAPAFLSPIWEQRDLFLSFPPATVDYATPFGFTFSTSGLDMWHILATGYYAPELSETLLVLRLLPWIHRFIDVGANVGYFSLLAATQSAGRVAVSCYEPSQDNFRTLQHAIELNGLKGTIKAERKALGRRVGEEDLYLCGLGSGGHSLEPGTEKNFPGPRERVPVITLDHIRSENSLENSPTLVKIDVEGAEHAVFDGARAWMTSEKPPILLFEAWHDAREFGGTNHEVMVDRVRKSGYTVFAIEHFQDKALLLREIVRQKFIPAPIGNYLALPGWALPKLPEMNKPVDMRLFTETRRLEALREFLNHSKAALQNHLRSTAAPERFAKE